MTERGWWREEGKGGEERGGVDMMRNRCFPFNYYYDECVVETCWMGERTVNNGELITIGMVFCPLACIWQKP